MREVGNGTRWVWMSSTVGRCGLRGPYNLNEDKANNKPRHGSPPYVYAFGGLTVRVSICSEVLPKMTYISGLYPIRLIAVIFSLLPTYLHLLLHSNPRCDRPPQMDSDDLFLRLQEWSSRIQQKVDEYKGTVEALKNLMVVVRAYSTFRPHSFLVHLTPSGELSGFIHCRCTGPDYLIHTTTSTIGFGEVCKLIRLPWSHSRNHGDVPWSHPYNLPPTQD